MESTCRATCKFWRKYEKGCPFYVETTWMPHDNSQAPKIVRDCSPKRSLLLQLEMHGKLETMIKASNQERNINHLVLTGIHEAIDKQAHPLINVTPQQKLIKADNNENTDRQIQR